MNLDGYEEGLAEAAIVLQSFGLPESLVLDTDSVSLEAIIKKASELRNVELANNLALGALAAQGTGKAINKMVKNLSKQNRAGNGSDFARDMGLA